MEGARTAKPGPEQGIHLDSGKIDEAVGSDIRMAVHVVLDTHSLRGRTLEAEVVLDTVLALDTSHECRRVAEGNGELGEGQKPEVELR